MDLKIKDVAELLSVSETTIRRWLSGGKIPAYRLNHQYRFSRIEIEKWMMSCKLDQEIGEEKQIFPLSEEEKEIPISKTGTQHFSLFRALFNGDVLTKVSGKTKEEVIRNSMKAAAPKLGLDAELAAELLLDRERLMSTSLSCGVAVPHPREFISKAPVDRVVLAFLDEPVDFEAFDKKPVHTLFFLFSSQDKKHLHLLAKIAHLSGSEEALEFFKSRPGKDPVLAFIKAWEGKIAGI
jgi:PTS system nitrogen regulatory IIA component